MLTEFSRNHIHVCLSLYAIHLRATCTDLYIHTSVATWRFNYTLRQRLLGNENSPAGKDILLTECGLTSAVCVSGCLCETVVRTQRMSRTWY